MTAPALVPAKDLDASLVESVLLQGDLSRLNPAQRVAYYNRVCDSLGLNPLTKPFDYLNLNGKTVLYAKRDATEQLRKIHGVSIVEIMSREVGGVFVVTAKAQDKQQRIDVSTGAVAIANLKGEALANALMKAETKAKRRVTLSICGLGLLDESEVETIPRAAVQAVATSETVNTETGEIVDATAPIIVPEPQRRLSSADFPDQHYIGMLAIVGPRTKGRTVIHDFSIDEQVMSTVDQAIANTAIALAGQRVAVVYAQTQKGGLLLKSIAAAPLEELTAEAIGFDK